MNIPFDPRGALIVVRAHVHGPSGTRIVRLALDTGATWSLINVNPLQSVGYDPTVSLTRVTMVTGSSVEVVPQIALVRIDALGQERRNLPILCHTLPSVIGVEGVLGLHFMREQRLIVDFRAGLVSLS